jgi:hypothetical protein
MIHRVLLRVATLLTLLAFSACTGPFARLIEGSGDPTDHRREPLDVSPAIEAMRRWSEPEVVTGGFQQAWELMQNERLASVQRTLLIRTRAESLLAMAVLADIQIDLDPITAEAMYVLLASEVAGEAGAEPEPDAIILEIITGLRQGDVPEEDVLFGRTLLEAALHVGDGESWYSEGLLASAWASEARLLALARVMRRFGVWSRRGTGSGGDVMIRDCGFLCDAADVPPTVDERAGAAGYGCGEREPTEQDLAAATAFALPQPGFEPWELLVRCGPDDILLPPSPGSPVMLSAANWLDALLLQRVTALRTAVADDLAQARPITQAAAAWLTWVDSRFQTLAVPVQLTSNALTADIRLDLPTSVESEAPAAWDLVVQSPRLRIVQVRSDGVFVAVRPHLRIDEQQGSPMLQWAEGDWHFPGRSALAFEWPGAIGGDQLVEGRVPALSDLLGDLELQLQQWPWVPGEELSEDRSLSIVADGDTYFSTMEPILLTAQDLGYTRLIMHVWSRSLNSLTAHPIRFGADVDEGSIHLRLREDGYTLRFQGADVLTATRVTPDALLLLYRRIAELDATARSGSLLITVEDGSADWGSVMNLVAAVAYEREGTETATTDRDLLRSSSVLNDTGPVLLVAQGIVLSGPR